MLPFNVSTSADIASASPSLLEITVVPRIVALLSENYNTELKCKDGIRAGPGLGTPDFGRHPTRPTPQDSERASLPHKLQAEPQALAGSRPGPPCVPILTITTVQ